MLKTALASYSPLTAEKGVPAGTPPITGPTSICDLITETSIAYVLTIVKANLGNFNHRAKADLLSGIKYMIDTVIYASNK